MFLAKFRLYNYKSFRDSGWLEFSPGINIIVGQNNWGKTALLEALTLNFENVPHRSLRTLPNSDSQLDDESRAEIVVTLSKAEFIDFINKLPEHSSSSIEILVWSKDAYENDREDLAIPLSACGTGIGQVLAILYVVLTSQEPRTIIIDEPQSFLHPGAAKLLKDLFSELSENRIEFRKTRHSLKLTEWLLEHEPEKMTELAEFLQTVIEGNSVQD